MVELSFSQIFLYASGVMSIFLILSSWWLLRLRKRLHELRGSEERYRTYIEHAPMGIFVAHDNGEFALVNPAISLMTGFSKNELSMMSLADFFSSDTAQEYAIFFDSVHQHKSSEKEVTLRNISPCNVFAYHELSANTQVTKTSKYEIISD
jgi:PAS domain-containing protein